MCFVALSCASSAVAYQARVAWSPVAGAHGYRLYVRQDQEAYGAGLDVGAPTSDTDGAMRFVLTALPVVATNYFAVTSYDASGSESARSNELSITYATVAPLVDSDGDGLSDAEEDVNLNHVVDPGETDPGLWDTDGDGISDGAERLAGSNPLDPFDPPGAGPIRTATATATPIPPTATSTPVATVTVAPVPGSDLTGLGGIIARVTSPTGSGNHSLEVIRDGDAPPVGTYAPLRQYDTFDGPNTATDDWIGYGFTGSALFRRLVFQEGMHFWDGGWFQSLRVEVRDGGQWTQVAGLQISPAYPGSDNGLSFETYVLDFAPTSGDAIRLAGAPGGSAAFISVGELRVFGDFVGALQAPTPTPTVTSTVTATRTSTATPTKTVTPTTTATRTATSTPTPTTTRTATPGPSGTPRQTATRTATPGTIATTTPGTTTTATATATTTVTTTVTITATATRTATPVATTTPTRTATSVPTVTATRTSTPVVTATVTGTATPIDTGTLARTSTPAPTETPVATGTSVATVTPVATDTPIATATGLSTNTPSALPATPTATLPPGPAATPGAGSCGNNVTEAGETCDGTDDAACPTLCSPTCACPAFAALPLDGWTRWQGYGTWGVSYDPSARGPVLRTEASTAPASGFGVAYPSDGGLNLTYPILAATLAGDGDFTVEVLVEQDRGPARVLAYASGARTSTIRRHRVQMPLGSTAANGKMRTFYRDLAADLRAAFGTAFVKVAQVRLLGNVRAAHLLLAASQVGGRDVVPADSLVVPLGSWVTRGHGVVVGHSDDPAVDGPTLSTDPAIAVIYPAAHTETLVAPFQVASFLVRGESAFAIELRIRTSDGRTCTVRYDERAAAPRASDQRAVLPLTPQPVAGSAFRLATLDLGEAVVSMNPHLSVQGILDIRLRGRFEIADLVLQDPVD